MAGETLKSGAVMVTVHAHDGDKSSLVVQLFVFPDAGQFAQR